jgi:hypothetical protein
VVSREIDRCGQSRTEEKSEVRATDGGVGVLVVVIARSGSRQEGEMAGGGEAKAGSPKKKLCGRFTIVKLHCDFYYKNGTQRTFFGASGKDRITIKRHGMRSQCVNFLYREGGILFGMAAPDCPGGKFNLLYQAIPCLSFRYQLSLLLYAAPPPMHYKFVRYGTSWMSTPLLTSTSNACRRNMTMLCIKHVPSFSQQRYKSCRR